MAGEIQLNSTSFASESGGTITVNNGTLSSSVVFPAGHIIQTKILDWQETTGNIFTSNSSYSNIGISGSFQTLKSSSESFLFFELHSGMTAVDGTNASQLDFCLTSSDNTTHSDGNSLSDVTYRNYYEPNNAEYEPTTFKAFFKAGTRTTSNLSSYSENQTLYLRIFTKTSATSFVTVHIGSNYYLLMQEIAL